MTGRVLIFGLFVPIEEKHLVSDDYVRIMAEMNPTTCIGSPLIGNVTNQPH